MRFVSLLMLTCAVSMAAPAIAAEPVLSQYRGVSLGDSVQVVVDRLQLVAANVKTVHERPAVVQELTWRPRPAMSGVTVAADSVEDIVLTFLDGRLARIAVNYDRLRTQGLTDADLNEAMDGVYGGSLLLATLTTPAPGTASERRTIGRWEDADARLVLWREQFPNRVGLTITSTGGVPSLEQVLLDAARLQTAEAPARDLARRNAEAAAIQARDEKIRVDNKTKFKPN